MDRDHLIGSDSDAVARETVERTLELWVRSTPTAGGAVRERALEHATHLVSRGLVEDVQVREWPSVIDRNRRPERESVATLEAFERWAEAADRTLEPCFRTREAVSTITGESTVVCRPPTVALAEYHDGDLAFVAPSRADEAVVDACTRLEALARRSDAGAEPDERTGETNTPELERSQANP